jgi:hypothetical protein
MRTIETQVIRPIRWMTQPTKNGQIRCWEIFTTYTDGTLSVTGEFKTEEDAQAFIDKG